LTPLLAAVLVIYSLHDVLTSVVGPLAAELQLTATQLGLVFTVASAAVALASPLWGLLLDAAGVRPVLVAGLALCVAGPAGFAAVVAFGLDETLTPDLAFALVLVFRSVLFAVGLASVLVAALAVAGLSTHGVTDRTRAISFVGAAQGLGVVLGTVAAGVLSVASLWLPLYVAPVVALLGAVLVLVTFQPVERSPEPVQVRPLELLPAFGAGFLLYLSLSVLETVVLHLAADEVRDTSSSVPGLLFASGLGLLLAQAVFVPLLRWSPARLMRIGSPVALAGCVVLVVAPSSALMLLAFLVLSVGIGLAITGFGATASLGVGAGRQGLVAGLVTATGGLAFIIGPVLGALLYEVEPLAPVLAAGLAAVLAAGLSLLPVTEHVPQSI
jgi:MFS family permease